MFAFVQNDFSKPFAVGSAKEKGKKDIQDFFLLG